MAVFPAVVQEEAQEAVQKEAQEAVQKKAPEAVQVEVCSTLDDMEEA